MATYKVTLTDRLGAEYGVLKPVGTGGVQFGDVLNGGGPAAVTVDIEDPVISGLYADRLDSWASEIVIERTSGPGDLGIVWAGPVAPPSADIVNRTVTINCLPLWTWLATERLITADATYANAEQTFIAVDLMTKYTTGLGPAGDIRVGFTSTDTGRRITSLALLATDQKTVGSAVDDLASADGGFDYAIVLSRQPGGKLVRTWQPFFPEKGRDVDQILTRGRGDLIVYTTQMTADIATRVIGSGQPTTTMTTTGSAAASPAGTTNPVTLTATAQSDPVVEDRYGIHVKPLSNTPSGDITASILQAAVVDELDNSEPPQRVTGFSYRTSKARPFGMIQTGDSVRVISNIGWATVDEWIRVVAVTVTVDSNGGETVDCTAATTPRQKSIRTQVRHAVKTFVTSHA